MDRKAPSTTTSVRKTSAGGANSPGGRTTGADGSPAETVKRATAAVVRALSGKRDVQVTYTPLTYAQNAAQAVGDMVRLPLPGRQADAGYGDAPARHVR